MELILVEDDPDDVYFFRRAFETLPNAPELEVFSNGKKLLEHINTTPTQNMVVLLDLNMPEMNGFEVMRQLQKQDQIQTLTIICYTTSTHPNDIRTAYKLGAKSYLTKPSRLQELSSLLETLKRYWFDYNHIAQERQ
ncbi:response regulator [Pseudoalteromonas sp. T1lg65]|uniref:response regulator n=1 Tax=Pseudoalteromonas sp. T1lg65 TaxID=2077101 RepID=UPI003F795DF0